MIEVAQNGDQFCHIEPEKHDSPGDSCGANIAQKRIGFCPTRAQAAREPVCLQLHIQCDSIAAARRTAELSRIMVSENNFELHVTVTRAAIPQTQQHWIDTLGTWPRFHRRLRIPGRPLLTNLAAYPRCVLVAGCQRSGTTMLTRLVAGASGFARLGLTTDDELDAALALAGLIELPPAHRYCFQTTYLNECFADYAALRRDQRLIWVLRNPYSVVYSMLYNWRRWALAELYAGCGIRPDATRRMRRAWWFWPLGPSQLEKACYAYAGKVAQIRAIRELVPREQLLVVDYDRLVTAPTEWLPCIFEFAGANYDPAFALKIRPDPARKADRLGSRARELIETVAAPVYRDCLALAAEATRPERELSHGAI